MHKGCEPGCGSGAVEIYWYHLFMLAIAFTVLAALAENTHRVALHNLLNFYLAHPIVAIAGSLLLIYCPPILDILPMYVVFLFLTPFVLAAAAKMGWTRLVTLSLAVWALAQVGLREQVQHLVVAVAHLKIPVQETGAFNLFAWDMDCGFVARRAIGTALEFVRADERLGYDCMCWDLCVFSVRTACVAWPSPDTADAGNVAGNGASVR